MSPQSHVASGGGGASGSWTTDPNPQRPWGQDPNPIIQNPGVRSTLGGDAGPATAEKLSDDHVPMIFSDGTQGFVPRDKVIDAIHDGGMPAHHMRFDDGSEAFVPHEKYQDALKDGGKPLDRSDQPMPLRGPMDAKDWGNFALTASFLLLPEVGALGKTATAVKAGAAVAEGAVPSLKTLWQIAKTTESASEVAGSEILSVGWKQFADTAYRGAAEAVAAGNKTREVAFNAAALAAKTYSKYEAAWAWLGKTIPGAPIGIKIAILLKLGKEGADWAMKDDEK